MQPGYKDVATDAAAIREGASSPQMRMIANPANTRPVAARLASCLMGTSELGASAFTAWVVDFKRIKSGR